MVPLEGIFARGAPLVMAAIYWRFSMMVSLSSPLVPMSTTFEGDLPLDNSSLSPFPLHVLKHLISLDQPLNDILYLDAVVNVGVMTPDGKMGIIPQFSATERYCTC